MKLRHIYICHGPYSKAHKYGNIERTGSRNKVGEALETFKSSTIAHVNTHGVRATLWDILWNPLWAPAPITEIEPCAEGENISIKKY